MNDAVQVHTWMQSFRAWMLRTEKWAWAAQKEASWRIVSEPGVEKMNNQTKNETDKNSALQKPKIYLSKI